MVRRRCGAGAAIFEGVAASYFLEVRGRRCHVTRGGLFSYAGLAAQDYHCGGGMGLLMQFQIAGKND